jgi:pSer/pThr/pTyr-binding forkhead associated (FHA) protein
MHLRYINRLGIPKDIELTGEPLSIGRSREADIPLLDDKSSRVHCGIRLSDGEFYLKDLKSRNGTYVNGQRVEDTVKLKAGDRIQIGSTVFVLEDASIQEDAAKGMGSVQSDMADGKGYTTILKEIVEDIEPTEATGKPAQAPAAEAPAPKPAGRPSIKIGSSIKIAAPKAEPAAPAPPAPATTRKKIIIKM